MSLYLHPDLQPFFKGQASVFDQIMRLHGESFRALEGRTTQRVRIGDKDYFIKQHRGIGWKEIFKNLLQGRLPVVSAKNEWQALQKLQSLGVGAPEVVGFGHRGFNPARMESFVIMTAVLPSESLETLCANWRTKPPSFQTKQALIAKVARITRLMHENGINHRDLYLCHYLLHQDELYLIDLHRAQMRQRVPARWRQKDLAGLYFSSKECGLTQRDLYRFMCAYRGKPLMTIFKAEQDDWQKIKDRGEKLYCDHENR